jgi:hypothetical protein
MSDWRVTCSSSSTPAGTYVQGIITLIRQISSVARHHGRVPDRLSTCSSHRSIKHGGDETTASTSPTPRSAQMTSYVAGLLARQGQAQPPRRVAWGAWLSGCCQGALTVGKLIIICMPYLERLTIRGCGRLLHLHVTAPQDGWSANSHPL